MKFSLLVVFVFASIIASAQDILRYDGPFENARHEKGTATYSYYKNAETGKLVKHGPFRYKVKIKDSKKRIYRNITGEYKSGWKDGTWEYSYTTKDLKKKDGYYYSYNVHMVANYDAGWPNGEWTYTASIKRRRNNVIMGKSSWLPYEVFDDVNMVAHFKHGLLVDSLRRTSLQASYSMFCDNDGFLNGTFKFSSDTSNVTIVYQDGFAMEKIPFNKVDLQVDEYDYYQKYKDNLNENGAALDTMTLTFYPKSLNKSIYNDEYFNYRFIDGDQMVHFVGAHKTMNIRYMGLYKRSLSVFLTEEEQKLIQGIFAYQIETSRLRDACEKAYKKSDNDIELRKKLEQLKSLESTMKNYTCLVHVYKTYVTPSKLERHSKSCNSDVAVSASSTRKETLKAIFDKAKEGNSKSKAIKW